MSVRGSGLCARTRPDIRYAFVCLIAFAGMVNKNNSRFLLPCDPFYQIVNPGDLSVAVFVNVLRQGFVQGINDDNVEMPFFFIDDLQLLRQLIKAFHASTLHRQAQPVKIVTRKSHCICDVVQAAGFSFGMQFVVDQQDSGLRAVTAQPLASRGKRNGKLQDKPRFSCLWCGDNVHDLFPAKKTGNKRFFLFFERIHQLLCRPKDFGRFCCFRLARGFLIRVNHGFAELKFFQNCPYIDSGASFRFPESLFQQGCRRFREVAVMFQKRVCGKLRVSVICLKRHGIRRKNIEHSVFERCRGRILCLVRTTPVLVAIRFFPKAFPSAGDKQRPDIAATIEVISRTSLKRRALRLIHRESLHHL